MMSVLPHPEPFHPVFQYHVETVQAKLLGLLGPRAPDIGPIEQRCNALGTEGWDLVGVAPVTDSNGATRELRLFFKRRVVGR